ncbi:MAG: serine hydrolase, partial [Gammaproteobacteria bacterium]|nr:serine hydrolase [Gammaproteobacteria bacterium]
MNASSLLTAKKALARLSESLFIIIFGVFCLYDDAKAVVPTATYLEFNNNQYVEIPYQSLLDLSVNTFTVSAWIRPLSWGQNNQGRIIDHGGGSSGTSGWSFHVQDSATVAQAIYFQINNDSSFNRSSNAGVVQLNTWQHVAVTYDNGTLTFYVNGVEQGVSTGVPVPNARISPLRIGIRTTDVQRDFDGGIDEVRIWNRALSMVEIQANMNVELAGTEIGLIAYYPFNNAMGQIAQDVSGQGNDATLGSTLTVDSNDPVWTSTVNQAPMVDAGLDRIIFLSDTSINLDGNVSDDGLPGAGLITRWSLVSGPAQVVFDDDLMVDTSVTFSTSGVYQLRLQADDGELIAFDEMTVTVDPTAVLTSIAVQPDTVSLDLNEMQIFTATGYDQGGNPFAITPLWSVTGGGIDTQGNYTAPALPGAYTVTATDGAVSGTSNVSVIDPAAYLWPTSGWTVVTPAEAGLQQTLLEQARDYALTGSGSGSIVKNGKKVFSWGDQTLRYDLKSTTKSFGAALTGLALKDGLIDLNTLAQWSLSDIGIPPLTNGDTGWLDQITVRHLLTHAAGFDKG